MAVVDRCYKYTCMRSNPIYSGLWMARRDTHSRQHGGSAEIRPFHITIRRHSDDDTKCNSVEWIVYLLRQRGGRIEPIDPVGNWKFLWKINVISFLGRAMKAFCHAITSFKWMAESISRKCDKSVRIVSNQIKLIQRNFNCNSGRTLLAPAMAWRQRTFIAELIFSNEWNRRHSIGDSMRIRRSRNANRVSVIYLSKFSLFLCRFIEILRLHSASLRILSLGGNQSNKDQMECIKTGPNSRSSSTMLISIERCQSSGWRSVFVCEKRDIISIKPGHWATAILQLCLIHLHYGSRYINSEKRLRVAIREFELLFSAYFLSVDPFISIRMQQNL